ncbi:UbiA family prenyltransferase [Nitratidesulfovibrio sp.]|uniref:UbiA family prenyltransferase n=1 Tax=Nitratidesulfovibrio sp. TaxID=2802297 RepID=UPI00333F5A93
MPRLHDLRLLLRLNVTLMVGAATAFGFLLAVPLPLAWDAGQGGLPGQGMVNPAVALAWVVSGAMLLAAACSAWNQVQERDIDALLPRTAGRPLPTGRMGRMGPWAATGIGALLFVAALGCLHAAGELAAVLAYGQTPGFAHAVSPRAGSPLSGVSLSGVSVSGVPVSGVLLLLVGVGIAVVYNGVYTPLKRVTSFALLPGALVGAMPPLLGWMAAGGDPRDPVAILLYGVYVLWQVPHFWLRAQRERIHYARAGLPVPPAQFAAGRYARLLRVWYNAYAVAVLMLPVFPLLHAPLVRAAVVLLGVALLAVSALLEVSALARTAGIAGDVAAGRGAEPGAAGTGMPERGGIALRAADAALPALMLLLLLDRMLPLF